MFDFNKFNKKDTKINLASLTFSIESYKKIKEKSQENLTEIAKDFFHLVFEFRKLKKQKREMKIVLLDDQLQELTTDMYGIFQLYFYKNLFDSARDSKKNSNKLFNEIFSGNKETNEEEMKLFARDDDL